MLSMLAFSLAAQACGGLFCDPPPTSNEPVVVQTGEEILFELRDGLVEMEVSIFYDGPPDDFAWVMPVPGLPNIAVGTTSFEDLRFATSPIYTVVRDTRGDCTAPTIGCADTSLMAVFDADMMDSGGVNVIAEETIGPYDTATLQARDSGELLAWLQGEGFAVPDDFDTALEPYVAEGQYFVALKLTGDLDVPRVEPVRLTYTGDQASIPLRLTAVAAAEDMLIDVYMLGASRGVPDNYLHVRLNDAAIDWTGESPGSNRLELLGRAVDEAGGQAFATTAVVEFGGQSLTRLTTVISPGEMTVDPVFSFNADIEQMVSPNKTARLTTLCGAWEGRGKAEQELELPDGRVIRLPTADYQSRTGTNAFTLTEPLHDPAAILITDYGAEGMGENIFDYRSDAERDARRHPRRGCSCESAAPLRWMTLGLLMPLLIARRRS